MERNWAGVVEGNRSIPIHVMMGQKLTVTKPPGLAHARMAAHPLSDPLALMEPIHNAQEPVLMVLMPFSLPTP